MPVVDLSSLSVREPVEGFTVRFVHTASMTLAYWDVAAGARLPEHSHPHEQVVNVIEGEIDLTVAGETSTLRPGTVAVIDGGVPHSGRARTACRIIDVFFPVREDYR